MDFFKYERNLQLIRLEALPKNPTTCAEISNAFESANIMNSIGRPQHVGNAIFFNGVVQEDDFSFCVFSSRFIMNMIESHIDNSRHYLLDATFKVVPVGPFNQLLIFYVNYIDKVSTIILCIHTFNQSINNICH